MYNLDLSGYDNRERKADEKNRLFTVYDSNLSDEKHAHTIRKAI